MTLFAWVLWRIVGKGQVQPVMLWNAIFIAAALFAVGHLPFLFAIPVHPQPLLIVSVMLGNFIPGLMFGWLFWRRGLEAAMLSHAFAHCVNATVS
jgi:membrane protease YdiL (CAAX protease family)